MSETKKRARRDGAIHYTEHACVALGVFRRRDPRTLADFMSDGIETLLFGQQDALADLAECWTCRPPGRDKPDGPRFSTSLARVTCGRCLTRYKRARERDGHTQRRRSAVRFRAWFACCRHAGAPSPMSVAATNDLLTRERALLRWRLIKTFGDTSFRMSALLDRSDGGIGAGLRNALERHVAALGDDDREALRPAIDEYTMAADLLVEVGGMFERARVCVAGVLASVESA